MNICRRYHPSLKLLSAVLLGLAGWAITLPAYAADFSMTNVEAKAKMLVNSAYDAKPLPIPAFLKDLSPEQYAQIQDVSPLWRGDNLPFQAQFYLPGSWFHRPVVIRSVVDGVVQPIRFTLKHFTFGDLNVPKDMPSELGYAGFRLLAPLLPRRDLFPRRGQGRHLRDLGTWPRGRHGSAFWRNLPLLQTILAGAAQGGRYPDGGLRAHGQSGSDGCLSLHYPAG